MHKSGPEVDNDLCNTAGQILRLLVACTPFLIFWPTPYKGLHPPQINNSWAFIERYQDSYFTYNIQGSGGEQHVIENLRMY